MSQHDLDIANQTASSARADINNALKALGSTSSGSSAPSTTYANMLWYDTGSNTLKMRTEADDQWISIGYMDQGADAFRIFDNTQIVNTSGSQTGLLGDQPTSTWQAGTGTTESLVSPAKIQAAIAGSSSAVLSTNGYQIMPSGLYMQWGEVTGVNAEQLKTASFPTAFPNQVFTIMLTPKDDRASLDFEVDLYSVAANPISLSQFTIMSEGTLFGTNKTIMFTALGR